MNIQSNTNDRTIEFDWFQKREIKSRESLCKAPTSFPLLYRCSTKLLIFLSCSQRRLLTFSARCRRLNCAHVHPRHSGMSGSNSVSRGQNRKSTRFQQTFDKLEKKTETMVEEMNHEVQVRDTGNCGSSMKFRWKNLHVRANYRITPSGSGSSWSFETNSLVPLVAQNQRGI